MVLIFPDGEGSMVDVYKRQLSALEHGLVLITGPSGSGKSTTLAHILLTAVAKLPCHIVTLEDPVEYVISSDKALVHQREIGEDTPSFAEGVIESLRAVSYTHLRRRRS